MKLKAVALQQIRLTGILLLLGVVAVSGALYWSSFQQQRQYLTSRDFRLLTALATQVQNLVDGRARIFQGAVEDVYRSEHGGVLDKVASDRDPGAASSRREALRRLAVLRDVEFELGQQPPTTLTTADRRLAVIPDGSRSKLRIEVVASSGKETILTVFDGLATLLEPTFTSKLGQDVFDTLALSTPEGRVVFVKGSRQQELQSTPIDAMLPTTIADPKRFQQLARTISVQDAIVAGVDYKLFVQPCCAAVTLATGPGEPTRTGLLLVGLIESDKLYGAALAISPTLVIAGVVVTLMALVVWPFLRLYFIGERQRVTVWDVMQLGACSIFGLGLASTVIITADVYARLNGDVDEQLEYLSKDLGDHLHSEIRLAYDQLSALQRRFESCSPGTFPNVVGGAGDRCSGSDTATVNASGASYPDYEAFALVDPSGWQRVKAMPVQNVSSRIRVQGRAYVDAIMQDRYWRGLAECSPSRTDSRAKAVDPPVVHQNASHAADSGGVGCFLESVWSWTDGNPQAVLSKPTGSPDYPVATLGFRSRALFDPVLPPGFEYAVVDGTGTVLFHSDHQRNTHENLFIETDHDRRLRALIAGHSSGALNVKYWGRAYRAYVRPAMIPDWSVVALSNKEGTRGLVLEWMAVSLLMLSLYIVAWILAIVVAIRGGASWMWPDVRRRQRYLALAVLYGALFCLFAAVAFTGDTRRLLAMAVAIAIAAWALAFVLLRQRPSNLGVADAQERSTTARRYTLAGALFLVLSGIVPGVAFVVRSYDMHIESYVKHRQLGLARKLAARKDAGGTATCGVEPLSTQLDRNCGFFYDTTVEVEAPASVAAPDPHRLPGGEHSGEQTAHHDLLQSLLEEYLPYYAESSVEMRELLHDHAADESWHSRREAGSVLRLELKPDRSDAIVVKSSLPAAVPLWVRQPRPTESDHDEPLVVLSYVAPMLLLCLVAVAYAIARFVVRHVYLLGVSEPLWATGRLVATAGANVLILCDDSSQLAGQLRDTSSLALGPIAQAADPGASWRRALMKIRRDDAGHAVVITDLDQDLDSADLTRSKLELLDELVNDPTRTVVVLLQNPPAMVQDSVRRAQSSPEGPLWPRLFKAFAVVDWRETAAVKQPSDPLVVESPDKRRWYERVFGTPRPRQSAVEAILAAESRHDRFTRGICADIRQSDAFCSGALTAEQVVDEIEERARAYYQGLWESCSDDEKVVLGHVAAYGFANAAARRTVRRLLMRRLLTKDPDLRLMNRTFRNFVLTPEIMRQVGQFEGVAEPSTWDRLRLPFALAAMSTGAFLFITQRDMFNQTVTVISAVAAAVPTVFRAVSVMAQRDATRDLPRA